MSSTQPEHQIAGVPFSLNWLGVPVAWAAEGSALTVTAGPRTDWFVDPGGVVPTLNAPALIGDVDGNFILSALVEVDFEGTFDAGALVLWHDESRWAKLCFEYSPQQEPMVVSMVTRGFSDDCNSMVVASKAVWLRIAHIGSANAFHASTDGIRWQLVRHFTLGEAGGLSVGFESQSPLGQGCTTKFTGIAFSPSTLAELRDGS